MLQETMVLYNAAQVALNGWTVYVIVDALVNKRHPLVGDISATTCTFAVWVHYCDKYLEFFDTWFMVLRGRLDQVSFLHVYHHTTIAWAWWAGMNLYSTGDSYFGALLNSLIHVGMYGYYTLALLGVSCPWKKYLTMAQLAQFASVMVYTALCFYVNHQKGQLSWKHILAMTIQVGEMASLFVLFFGFYKKSYKSGAQGGKGGDKAGKGTVGSRKKNDDLSSHNDLKDGPDDACNVAVRATGEFHDECSAAIGTLVKPVQDAVSSARTGVASNAKKAANRPSWALFGGG